MNVDLAQPVGTLAAVDAPPARSWKSWFGGRWTRLLLIAVLVLGGTVVYKRSTERAVHDFDRGPVRSQSDTTTSIHADIGQVVTFGGIIVENFSKRDAILERIRIEPPLDPAVSLVDVKVAGKDRGAGQVGADVGFPSPHIRPETLRPLPGAIVPAGEHDWGVEVLMAFKLNQPGQFGFQHALIDYRIGDKRHRLRVSDGFVICGGPDYPANCDIDAFRRDAGLD
jgi:hypothetical protein